MDKVVPALVSFFVYTAAAGILTWAVKPPTNLTRKEQKDHLGHHLSILHAYIAIFFSSAVYVYEEGVDYNASTNSLHIAVLGNSLGYFIFDSVYAEYYGLHDAAMRFHHIFALFGLFVMYFSVIGGSAAVCNFYLVGVWLAEISNPCLLKRHILRAKELDHTVRYTIYENLFVVIFITARVGWGTWYVLKVWASNGSWMFMTVSSAIYAVSLFWVFVIITKALKRFSGSSDNVTKKIILIIKYLRQNKALLLVLIVLISYGIPILLTQMLDIKLLKFEVDGFKIM